MIKMDKFCKFLSKILRNHCMAIYRDTGVFCLSITGTENFQYRPLLRTDRQTERQTNKLHELHIYVGLEFFISHD